MNTQTGQSVKWCKRLRLGESFIEATQSKKASEREFLLKLLESEIDRRDALAIQRNIKAARFPELKFLQDFDFQNVRFPQGVTRPYFTECRFVDDKMNLLFLGNPGTGKTHLATALGVETCRGLQRVFFARLHDLVRILRNEAKGEHTKEFQVIKKAHLLIIDEFGFPPQDADAIPLLFEFVSVYAYEKKSVILTSNRTFEEWQADYTGTQNEKMVQALIDRLSQDLLPVAFEGQSHRTARQIAI